MRPGRGEAGVPAGRAGVGAVEVLVALVLFALVVHGAWRVFATQRSAAEEQRLRTEILDADRVVRVVLGAELAAGVPGRDWSVTAPGQVELRAFRGWAVPCPDDVADGLVVAYRGLRAPDPDKDSALVLGGGGRWTAVDLVYRTVHRDGCDGASGVPVAGARLERWRLEPPVPDAAVLRVFERGSYHLVDGALRYRRGLGGRQPLTPAVLDADLSGLRSGGGDSTAVLTVVGKDGRGGGWIRTLFGNGDREP